MIYTPVNRERLQGDSYANGPWIALRSFMFQWTVNISIVFLLQWTMNVSIVIHTPINLEIPQYDAYSNEPWISPMYIELPNSDSYSNAQWTSPSWFILQWTLYFLTVVHTPMNTELPQGDLYYN